jgi:ribosomal protein S18 acetylase RimI-like enzyme
MYIANFGVKPELRGKGVGSALINFAADSARERGLTALLLDVSATNPRAENLYRRLGFEVTGIKSAKASTRGVQLPDAKSMLKIL